MLVLLLAWLFWLLINGRLQVYAAFVTTAGSGGIGQAFKNFSIPISLSSIGNALSPSPGQPGAPGSGTSASPGGNSMPSFTSYQGGLPAGDSGVLGQSQAAITGYYPSGLPSFSTLGGLTDAAGANVAGGAAGL